MRIVIALIKYNVLKKSYKERKTHDYKVKMPQNK